MCDSIIFFFCRKKEGSEANMTDRMLTIPPASGGCRWGYIIPCAFSVRLSVSQYIYLMAWRPGLACTSETGQTLVMKQKGGADTDVYPSCPGPELGAPFPASQGILDRIWVVSSCHLKDRNATAQLTCPRLPKSNEVEMRFRIRPEWIKKFLLFFFPHLKHWGEVCITYNEAFKIWFGGTE